jgi:hypothetical protein
MMVSFDGLWRSLPGLVLLSPAEADTLLGRVHELAGVVAERDPEVAMERPVETIPHSMWIEAAPPPHQISVLVNDTFVTLLPNLLAEALTASKPQPAVSDDAVAVRALVTAGDLGALWGGLLERDDVHRHRCDELWWSSDMDSGEDSANDIQATIRLDDGSLAISVGAKAHLDAALAVMREIEPSAMVVRQTTSPAGAPPAPWAAAHGVTAQAVALWERQWPDEAAFALHCYSPREAAGTNDSQPLVELMLRELEFHAARARAEGRPAPDMAVVRDGLGMALPPTALTVPTAA